MNARRKAEQYGSSDRHGSQSLRAMEELRQCARMASVKKVRTMAAEVVGPNTEVLGAFIGICGPRPGIEVLGGLAGTGVLLLTGSRLLLAAVVVASFAGVTYARRFYIVIRTNDEVLLVDNGRRSRPRADASVTHLPPNSISVSDAEGDPAATVGHTELWLQGEHQDEARRLSRLMRP